MATNAPHSTTGARAGAPAAGRAVAGGPAWTIIDLFLGLVLGPIMGSISIPARVEFTARLMPKMVIIMPVVVTITLAAGCRSPRTWARSPAVIERLVKRSKYCAGVLGVLQIATLVIMTKLAASSAPSHTTRRLTAPQPPTVRPSAGGGHTSAVAHSSS